MELKPSSIECLLGLFQKKDSLTVPLATGQPQELLYALSEKKDWEKLSLFCGLCLAPYPILTQPTTFVTSGYYGPIERMLNEMGAHMEYLPLNFTGFETYALKKPDRVIATTLSPPDQDGFATFGTHGAAIYKPFIEACRNKKSIAIAEINSNMPTVYGHPDFGDNKIHISEIPYYYESGSPSVELPPVEITPVEEKIADYVLELIRDEATLQFGIGAIPNLVCEKLANSNLGNFGIHSELISDGFLKLLNAGKISNRKKGIFENSTVFTFALGSKNLYDFLDEKNQKNKRQAICLPVSVVNEPSLISKNRKFTSINSTLMVDFAGQVSSEAISQRQYSGVGGQLSFVEAVNLTLDGISIICLKSTASVETHGNASLLVSNIVPTLPLGSIVSTPRHYVQYIVTEYGIADLYGVSDEKRAEKLITIAHPQFRDDLRSSYEEMKKVYYKSQ